MNEEQAALDEQVSPAEINAVTTAETEAGATTQADSATANEDGAEFVATENDKVQARFNQITADKYAEKRRADEAEDRLAQIKANQPAPIVKGEPKLEDFDFDESAHMAALIDYKVEQKAQEIQQDQQRQVQAQTAEATLNNFQEKVVSFQKQAPDFEAIVAAVPQLPQETLDAIMQNEKGPELAYYLGKHLNVADEIVNMSPIQAAMKLGQISVQLTATPQTVKTSAAPEPIEPIMGEGNLTKDDGLAGATYE